MSKRKERQISRTSPEDRVIALVKSLSDRPFVESVSDHFAGYFNELGLTLTFASDARDEDVIALQNDLLEHMNRFWGEQKPSFTWMLMFSRGDEKMLPMLPFDKPRSTDDLHWHEV